MQLESTAGGFSFAVERGGKLTALKTASVFFDGRITKKGDRENQGERGRERSERCLLAYPTLSSLVQERSELEQIFFRDTS